MRNNNLAWLLANQALASEWSASPAYYAPNIVTHAQIHEGAARLGNVFGSRGLRTGDRVLLCLPDSTDLVQLLLACLARGIVAFISNPELRPDDHTFQEQDTQPALVVTTDALRDRFARSGIVDPGELWAEANQAKPAAYEPLTGDALAYGTYTSGTTGAPKAALHRHGDVWAFIDAMCRNALRLTPDDVGLSIARMYFAYGLGNSVWFPLATGSSAVISRSPLGAESAANLSERFSPSVLYGVPTFLARVADTCAADAFRSLRCVVSAGEALELGLAQRLMKFFGGIPLLDGIGSTEVGQTFISSTVDEWRLGTLGKVLSPYEIRVVAPDGTTAAPGVEGDLWVRGPSLTAGYWNRPTQPPSISDSWLDTRDRVCVDAHGWVTYRCRADDIEIVGGININPREIEQLIVEDHLVAETAVVAVREATGESALQAFLVPESGASLGESAIKELHRRLLGSLSPHKVPHRFEIAERLPRTASGKLQRGQLRTQPAAQPVWERRCTVGTSDSDGQRDPQTQTNYKVGPRVGPVTLDERLAVLQQEGHRLIADTVSAEVAQILGDPAAERIDRDVAFAELGFDSRMTVELRNRLAAVTGLRLPETVGWDYGSISRLAAHLETELAGSGGRGKPGPSVAGGAPVAIVGVGCRYPGGVESAGGLWDVVVGGRDVISGFPVDRGWDVEGVFDPDPDALGKTYCRLGGFLDGADRFDAGFFGIGPSEALAMDPQQRLLLECSWEALEDAGIDPVSLRGSVTGVFTGLMSSDYGAGRVSGDLEGYGLTSAAASVASGRVAYLLGLEGPAVSVDTACSSSLVALHLAAASLRSGECDVALAGGVTVMATPATFVGFSRQRGLAADGRCKAFAGAADGTGFSEGAGVVVLMRLSEARRRGLAVLGVIAGSAVNQDGASNGLTAPNGPAQQRVIEAALANAGLTAADVDVVEGHGTGTTLGDPIEAQALLATYGQARPADQPLWLGSIKSNMGHTQAAAGIAGVIKMVQAMRHELMPATLHVDVPSPHVDWSSGAVSLLTQPRPWPAVDGRPRRAGVSSFGISGTNAHVIVEQVCPEVVAEAVDVSPDSLPWVVSGKSEAAVAAQAKRLLAAVQADEGLDRLDVGFSLARRTAFEYRAVVLGEDRQQLISGLTELAAGQPGPTVLNGRAATVSKTVMVFPGQGSQWPGMGRELLAASPVFAEHMRLCAEALGEFVDWSLLDVVNGVAGAPTLDRVDVVQPVLWAMMVSLAQLWRSVGVVPDAVIGHSQGEIAAACVAGALSLRDGAAVVALRSRALVDLAGTGGMVAIACGVERVRELLADYGDRLSLAAVNGVAAVVVSGEAEALRGLTGRCEAAGMRARRVEVDYASHSAQVESIGSSLVAALAGVRPRSSDIEFVSTVTGASVDGASLDADYWYRNIRQTVRFDRAVRYCHEQGCRTFVEASPHPVLLGGIEESLAEGIGRPDSAGVIVIPTLGRNEGGVERFWMSLSQAWLAGVGVDWSAVF
ncbi:beta-ketoacyl synthase N-terminal-like domain-containing protein, partial [Mycobacterium marinum]|uniref:beta-ketoacyl synthase N-terminal-like domain-containing protein n=1 Tax=Mycobacterium marinum TaxID=1781 RepID=UPI003563C34A